MFAAVAARTVPPSKSRLLPMRLSASAAFSLEFPLP
jgi:hypothetical protein